MISSRTAELERRLQALETERYAVLEARLAAAESELAYLRQRAIPPIALSPSALDHPASSFSYFAAVARIGIDMDHLQTYNKIKSSSSLLFTTLIALGARHLGHVDTLNATFHDALRVGRAESGRLQEMSVWDLKAITLLTVHFGNLPCYSKPYPDVVDEQANILRSTPQTRPQIDVHIFCYTLIMNIVARANDFALSDLRPLQGAELQARMNFLLGSIDSWQLQWGSWLRAATQVGGDNSRMEAAFHHSSYLVLNTAFPTLPTELELNSDPLRLSYAQDLVAHGTKVLELISQSPSWGLQSPWTVHFMSVILHAVPPRLVSLALLSPAIPHRPILRALLKILYMMERFPVQLLTEEHVLNAGHVQDLVAQLDRARPGPREIVEPFETLPRKSSTEILRADLGIWHEVLGSEIVPEV
ncbi:Homeodomain-like protein [Pseudohyphozyma bogoriensis]|nr:Homeodomain-like protein [Pseudohyphozyma bogoriensis]